jgi:peptide deformylase
VAVRTVVRHPDPRLKQRCVPVGGDGPLEGPVRELAVDLLETMDSFPGCVGIAAPQVGELVRMVAIDVREHPRAKSCHGRLVLVDPAVEASSGRVKMREGCLSIPDFTGNVVRAKRVVVTARGIDGEALRLEADAFEARVLLHELDHLDGLLFLDRVASAREVFPRKHYQ